MFKGQFQMTPGLAVLLVFLLFVLVVLTVTLLLLLGHRSPTVSVLRAAKEIRPCTRITADELTTTSVSVHDSSTLVKESDRLRIVGQTSVRRVPAGALVPANVSTSQASESMWETAVPVKRMPVDLRPGDHVAVLAASSQSGRSMDVIVIQDVAIVGVSSGSADMCLPYNAWPQIEWYADNGNLVLLKMQAGAAHPNVPPGEAPRPSPDDRPARIVPTTWRSRAAVSNVR